VNRRGVFYPILNKNAIPPGRGFSADGMPWKNLWFL